MQLEEIQRRNKMTPLQEKFGDCKKFVVTIDNDGYFNKGEVVELKEDDGSSTPWFWNKYKTGNSCLYLEEIEPYTEEQKHTEKQKIDELVKNLTYEVTLRDKLAIAAMEVLLSTNASYSCDDAIEALVSTSYIIADEMLKESNK